MQISLKQLRFFAALARTGHFRKAAEAEGVTQPSLSAQIANLEEALGFQLVERKTGGLTLTPSGREIEARARRVLDEVQGLQDLADGLRVGDVGVLRIGVSSTVGPYLMPHVVRDLHRRNPDMGLFIREGAPRALEQELLAGSHDVIISQLPLTSTDVMSKPLFREPLMLVVEAGHPLVGLARVQDSDLAGVPVMTLGRGYALNEMVAGLCVELGARLMENYEGTSLDALRQMIGMGMGTGFLPALYVRSEILDRDPSVVALPFRAGRFTRTVGFAWRPSTGRQKIIDTVIRQVQTTCREQFSGVVTVM